MAFPTALNSQITDSITSADPFSKSRDGHSRDVVLEFVTDLTDVLSNAREKKISVEVQCRVLKALHDHLSSE